MLCSARAPISLSGGRSCRSPCTSNRTCSTSPIRTRCWVERSPFWRRSARLSTGECSWGTMSSITYYFIRIVTLIIKSSVVERWVLQFHYPWEFYFYFQATPSPGGSCVLGGLQHNQLTSIPALRVWRPCLCSVESGRSHLHCLRARSCKFKFGPNAAEVPKLLLSCNNSNWWLLSSASIWNWTLSQAPGLLSPVHWAVQFKAKKKFEIRG